MPDGRRRARRAALSKRFLAGVVVGVALAGIGIGAVVAVNSGGSKNAVRPPTGVPGIDMSKATGFACGAPVAAGPGHPDPLLSQVFNVHDASGTSYVMGWQLVPFRGTGRSYRFGTPGALLALQPATGGPPLGYGKGTLTFRGSSDAGTIDAVVKLKTGRSLTVRGSWRCVIGSTATTQVQKPPIVS